MIYLGKAEVIEEYREEVHSQKISFLLPAVIRLVHEFKRYRRQVSFSKNNVLARDKWTCQYCLKKFHPDKLTLDHVLPKSRGGPTTWENIVACCDECNGKKGSRTPVEARMELKKKPSRPEWISFFNVTLAKCVIPTEWKYFCYF
jgi:5-methylcytosine-specific restriction endonuclease McrA